MITWLKTFLFDQTAFTGLVRALLQGAGAAQAAGLLEIEGLPKWVGIAAVALGGFLRAGDKNPDPT